jgi:hypothetical protein
MEMRPSILAEGSLPVSQPEPPKKPPLFPGSSQPPTPPTQPASNPEPGGLSPTGKYVAQQIGFHLVIYSVVLLVNAILYPFSKQFIEPIVALVFPIAEGSIWKSLGVLTLFYWLGAVVGMWRHRPKSS